MPENAEVFSVMRHLFDIEVPHGVLSVNKLSLTTYDSSVVFVFQFEGEGLEISGEHFREGLPILLEMMNSENGILAPGDSIIGYARRADGRLVTMSCDGRHLYETEPEDTELVWPAGTVVLTPVLEQYVS